MTTNKKIFAECVILLAIVCLLMSLFGCSGKKITSGQQTSKLWEGQIDCMNEHTTEDISWIKEIENEDRVVNFRIKGNKNWDAVVWYFEPAPPEGWEWHIGWRNGKEVIYRAGIDVPIEIHPKTGNTYLMVALYENGKYKTKLKRHEDTHKVTCLMGECDMNHESFWYVQRVCQ